MDSGESLCILCGEAVSEDDGVHCAACASLHHRDCWDYGDRCCKPGCSSTSIETPTDEAPVTSTEGADGEEQVSTERHAPAVLREFLEKYADTELPICPSCLGEYQVDRNRCPRCACALVAGPTFVTRCIEHLDRFDKAVDDTIRERARLVSRQKSGEDDGTRICPACGTLLEDGSDVCEICLAALSHTIDEEHKEQYQHDPELIERTMVLRDFLRKEKEQDSVYCPQCLEEYRSYVTTCVACAVDLLPPDKAELAVRSTLEDFAGSWFVPALVDVYPEFFDAVLSLVETSELSPEEDFLVKRQLAEYLSAPLFYFVPIGTYVPLYQRILFVRLIHLDRFYEIVSQPDLAEEFPDEWAEVSTWWSGETNVPWRTIY